MISHGPFLFFLESARVLSSKEYEGRFEIFIAIISRSTSYLVFTVVLFVGQTHINVYTTLRPCLVSLFWAREKVSVKPFVSPI